MREVDPEVVASLDKNSIEILNHSDAMITIIKTFFLNVILVNITRPPPREWAYAATDCTPPDDDLICKYNIELHRTPTCSPCLSRAPYISGGSESIALWLEFN